MHKVSSIYVYVPLVICEGKSQFIFSFSVTHNSF